MLLAASDSIPEIYIWRTAQLMMKRFGESAIAEAERRAGELIEDLQKQSPGRFRPLTFGLQQ